MLDLGSKKTGNENKHNIPIKGLKKIKAVFDSMDTGGKGYVTLPELKKGLSGSFSAKESEEIFKKALKNRQVIEKMHELRAHRHACG